MFIGQIFCKNHQSLKIMKEIELKKKKFKEELMIFKKKLIEKNLIKKNKPEKKAKIIKESQVKIENENNREDNLFLKINKKINEVNIENRKFIKIVENEYKKKEEFLFILELEKKEIDNSNEKYYKVKNFRTPKPFKMKLNISKNDEIWEKIPYGNYIPVKIYQKYRQIMEIKREKLKKKRMFDFSNDKILKNLKIENENKLYCVCKQTYNEGENMIGKLIIIKKRIFIINYLFDFSLFIKKFKLKLILNI